MVLFFEDKNKLVYAVDTELKFNSKDILKLEWLFNSTFLNNKNVIQKKYLGPRKTMVSPWSTNAVEITQNMAIIGINRIEQFELFDSENSNFDPMLFEIYSLLDQNIFKNNIIPDPLIEIENISKYNEIEGLALSNGE